MAFCPHPAKRRSTDAEVRDFPWIDVLRGDSSAGYRSLDRVRCGVSLWGEVSILITGGAGRCPDRELDCQYTYIRDSNSYKPVLIIL